MSMHIKRKLMLLRLGTLALSAVLLSTGCADVGTTSADDDGSGQASQAAAAPEGYPQRPVELNVVYPAGGGMDVTARALAAAAEEVIGDKYRVVNREGAGGLVGHTYLAKQAKPEGYELGVIAVDFLFFDITLRDATFGKDDLAPLAYIAFEPVVQVVRADSELADMEYKQILAQAKENPGDLRVGVVPNTTFDVFTKVVSQQSGAEFTTVPFDGGKPGVTALLSGDIDITNAFYGEVQAFIDSGDLVPIAISDNTAYAALPDVPTMGDVDIDVPDKTFGAGRMLMAPAGMDRDFQEYLAQQFLEVLQSDTAVKQFEEVGAPLDPAGIEQARELYASVFEELPKVLEEAGNG
jgi:tripartite-type tricarboxylate transporter receptor subunit TctC